jgi:hypothetical protein
LTVTGRKAQRRGTLEPLWSKRTVGYWSTCAGCTTQASQACVGTAQAAAWSRAKRTPTASVGAPLTSSCSARPQRRRWVFRALRSAMRGTGVAQRRGRSKTRCSTRGFAVPWAGKQNLGAKVSGLARAA